MVLVRLKKTDGLSSSGNWGGSLDLTSSSCRILLNLRNWRPLFSKYRGRIYFGRDLDFLVVSLKILVKKISTISSNQRFSWSVHESRRLLASLANFLKCLCWNPSNSFRHRFPRSLMGASFICSSNKSRSKWEGVEFLWVRNLWSTNLLPCLGRGRKSFQTGISELMDFARSLRPYG